ncbi:MAG: helix-hairpin-helix domain-containing protein, partial [Methanomicrobiales archaeon]|nr:helix-hairpin-helix domain-containing protein [Methanomicrobiales archaeon]
ICPIHALHHVRLIRKGVRPWDIGCALCTHISSHAESLRLIPSMTESILERLHAHHIFTIADLIAQGPDRLAPLLALPKAKTERLIQEAQEVLVLLRKRSDLRKFVRAHLPPRKGRKQTEIMTRLFKAGIDEVRSLARTDPQILIQAGMSEKEADMLLVEVQKLCHDRLFREMGIPAASRKKYGDAGITTPEDLCDLPPVYVSHRTGLSLDTVMRHLEKACNHLGRKTPRKPSRTAVERGKNALLSLPGLGESTLEKLYRAGITGLEDLAQSDPAALARTTGLPESRLREYILSAASHGT